jgi:heat shock protein HtpX
MIFAFGLALVMNFASYWWSDRIALSMSGAREVSPAEAPELHRMVEEIAQYARMPKPRVYIIDTPSPNAFATGRDPEHAAIAVTTGILGLLNREELAGVLSHELAHVRNRDTLIATVAATIAGAISMIANLAQWALIFGGLGRNNDEEGPSWAGSLLTIIIAPIIALLIQLAVSRAREFEADRSGAQILGKPLALASALEKLQAGTYYRPMDANPATAHLFIVNPFGGLNVAKLLSTHPPIEERVARLRAMAGYQY